MRVPYLDLKAIHEPLEEELHRCFFEVMDESYFLHGREVTEFERAFSEKLDVEYCLGTANCTDSLFIVLKMLGIGDGDEVIVPAMTWITDAEVVSNLGASPVFVDIDPITYTIDTSKIEAVITSKTKAIVPVHLYGQMADMTAICEIAERHGIKVIEDCAQAHFASQNGKFAGSFGDAAVFSFYPTKNLGALGDAGAIVTNDKSLCEACRKMANHGALDKHSHEFPGMNSRMDTLQAAVLLLKLDYIDQWNEERRKLATAYTQAVGGINGLILPQFGGENQHVFHIFNILTSKRDELKHFLSEAEIQTQIHYPKALPFTQAYQHLGFQSGDFPEAFRLQNEGLSLPIYPGMEGEMQEFVIEKVKEFFS
ncbi:MAG: DegT/DnrJ/EryC1/StrS family aminotransferase [Cytophagia bacterium]|nr:DegT/DnrJ/EryC1/StrS family aminotransferase [Cytophagia bacterium]